MTTKTFNVNGMKCMHCKANVENAIQSLDGVQCALADIGAKNVKVDYDESRVKDADLKAAVEGAGHYELQI